MSDREKETTSRCLYASQLFTKEGIEHQIKKESIGHINLSYKGKCVMSFWARTGRFIFNICPPEPIITSSDRGIKSCMVAYWQLVDAIKREYES